MSSLRDERIPGLEFIGRLLPFVYAAIFIVAVWLAVVAIFRPHESLLPQPWAVAKHLGELVASGELFKHIGASLSRVLSAWCLAGAIAIPLGLAMGRLPLFERIMDPLIELFRPISP